MYLEIVSPDKIVYSGNIRLIQVPGSKGSFEILKGHSPIISTLDNGSIKIITDNGEQVFFKINGGVIEFAKNKAIVLVESV
jgi:F-type H+-transporting ATPase subunit epsilon